MPVVSGLGVSVLSAHLTAGEIRCIYTYMDGEIPKEIAPIAESPYGCACFNMRRAARAITQLYDEVLAPVGLKSTQFSLLIAIRVKGGEGIGALADALVTDRTTLTRNIRHLVDGGYVAEMPGEDRRARLFKLTAKGKRTLEKAGPRWIALQERVEEALGADGMRALRALSDDIVQLVHPELEIDLDRKLMERRRSGAA